MRKLAVIGIAAIITGLAVGVVIAGSGGDKSGSSDVSVPELTPPPGSLTGTDTTSTTKKKTKTTGATGATGTSGPDTGGSTAPDTGGTSNGGGAQAPQDTQQNDQPPPSGSPADRFEQFCKDNPGAC